MGWVRRGRANADPAVPRASPVPPGQAPHLVLLQLLHQDLGTEGHTDTKDVSPATAAQRLRRPVPSRPVPSRPVAARPARPERRLRAHLGGFLAGSGLQEPCDQKCQIQLWVKHPGKGVALCPCVLWALPAGPGE
ncbi:hypothetical protein Nmel_012949 [Mimus melanotis]